jgi:transposase
MSDLLYEHDVQYLRTYANLLENQLEKVAAELARTQIELQHLKGEDVVPMQERIAVLSETVRLREQALYGKSSERRGKPDEQPEADAPGDTPAVDLAEPPTVKAPRRGHGRRPHEQLRVIEQTFELPEDQRTCGLCGDAMQPMTGQFEAAEMITALTREIARVICQRQKYNCRCYGPIVTAPGPVKLQAGSRYTLAFAADVAVAKYVEHQPLNRQVEALKWLGLTIDTQTLWDQIQLVAKLAKPTHEAILAHLLEAPVLHADETRWRVMIPPKQRKGQNKQWYVWCAATEEAVGYRILDSRSKDAAGQILTGFQGTLVVDGYASYPALQTAGKQGNLLDTGPPTDFELAFCWSHARRKFVEAEPNAQKACGEVLALLGLLFEVERRADAAPEADRLQVRHQLRQAESRPLIAQIKAWSQAQRMLPQSTLGKAIAYMNNHWAGLLRFLDDPAIPLTNNLAERALRGIVLGRHNHLGSRSPEGAEATAILYTVLQSARLTGVNPKDYLIALLTQAIQEPGTVLLPADFRSRLSKSTPPA